MTGRELELEARLKTLEAALFDASPNIQLLCEVDGVIIARNAAARELGEATSLDALFAEPAGVESLRRRYFLGADQAVLRLQDGRQVMIAAAPVTLEGTRYWEVVLHDVTTHALVGEEQQVTRQLAMGERIGRLVSHEITSPLAVLLGRIELLQTLGSPSAELLQRHLRVMGEHARRIAAVIQALDALTVKGQGQLATVGVEKLLKGVLQDSDGKLDHLSISLGVEPPDLSTTGHASRLHQVFCALLAQLAGHLGPGAGVSVRARGTETEVVVELLGHAAPHFAMACRRILDSWCPEGEGQDLGAAVALNTLVAHSGRLEGCGHQPGLRLILPRRGPVRIEQTGLRILFVDDEASIVQTTLSMLESLGHAAVGVQTAEEALAELENSAFDAVLTDLVLPGLSGLGLREAIAQRWPGLEERVVIVSGARQAPPEAVVFVPKPYSRQQLKGALERVCGDIETLKP